MAKIAFVLIDTVLGAIQSVGILDFRMAKETAVFVAVVLLAPEAACIPHLGITEKARLPCGTFGDGVEFDVGDAAPGFFRAVWRGFR